MFLHPEEFIIAREEYVKGLILTLDTDNDQTVGEDRRSMTMMAHSVNCQ